MESPTTTYKDSVWSRSTFRRNICLQSKEMQPATAQPHPPMIMSLKDKAGTHCEQEHCLHDDPKIIEAAAPEYVEGTPQEKRLVRKIDMHLIPILWAMYVFNYLDRTNIGVSANFEVRYTCKSRLTPAAECQSWRNGKGPLIELLRLLPDSLHLLRRKSNKQTESRRHSYVVTGVFVVRTPCCHGLG